MRYGYFQMPNDSDLPKGLFNDYYDYINTIPGISKIYYDNYNDNGYYFSYLINSKLRKNDSLYLTTIKVLGESNNSIFMSLVSILDHGAKLFIISQGRVDIVATIDELFYQLNNGVDYSYIKIARGVLQ